MKNTRGPRIFSASLFLYLLLATVARCDTPSLEVISVGPAYALQLVLHGQDTNTYEIETSTDLVSWQPFLSLGTSNGIAIFNHDGTSETMFFRAHQSYPPLQFQTSSFFSVDSVVTPDGGVAEIVTPDLHSIRLTIPAGCVNQPLSFTMTLITNIIGFPFSQGSFGAVTLEPQDLMLAGAATLEIEFPSGLDLRQVVSFEANNDGSAFGLAMDKVATNSVMIPITRFSTYGSCLALQSELDDFANPALKKTRRLKGGGDPCPVDPDHHYFDSSQFMQSTVECFPSLVARALAVRDDLYRFKRCKIEQPIAEAIADARQQDLLGQDGDYTNIVASALAQVCPIYKGKIEPLWAETGENCALGQVLLEFTLGIERQLQTYGYTNYDCPLGLSSHLKELCTNARECLSEIRECCGRGFKGPGKAAEAWSVLHPFVYLGDTSCFSQEEDDPQVLLVIAECMTNRWFGTMNLTQTSRATQTQVEPGPHNATTTTTYSFNVDCQFGEVYDYFETPLTPQQEGYLTIKSAGAGTIRLHLTTSKDELQGCSDGNTVHEYILNQTDSIGTTNVFGQTNDLAQAQVGYEFEFLLKTNGTFQLLTFGNDGLNVRMKARQSLSMKYSGDCKGLGTLPGQDPPVISYSDQGFPGISSPTPLIFSMTDSNSIQGSVTLTNVDFGSPIDSTLSTTRLQWHFHRNPAAPASPGP